MYLFQWTLSVYFILGCLFRLTYAGLLDSLGGVIELGINGNNAGRPGTNTNLNRGLNPIINLNSGKNFNKPNINNNNYPNNNIIPSRNNNNDKLNGNNMGLVNQLKDFDLTTKASNLSQGSLELTEKEMIAAQKFPELQKLLEKLKELNRLKELEKQKNLNNSTTTSPVTTNINDDQTTTKGPSSEEINGWKQLKKRKFFFMVQPIKPEPELEVNDEIVYYLD